MSGARVKVRSAEKGAKRSSPARKPRRSESRTEERRPDSRTPARADHRLEALREPSTAAPGPTANAAPTGADAARTGADPDQPAPSFKLPEMPATELAPETRAARRAELAEAKAAIARARTASGVVDAFAEAPPSVKARTQGSLDARIERRARQDHERFVADLPEMRAQMGGEPLGERAEVPPIRVPSPDERPLEGRVEPDRQAELPPVKHPGPFTANEKVAAFFERFFNIDLDELSRAAAVERSIDEIRTGDDIETSAGLPPKLVMAGETDLGRIDAQKDAGKTRGRKAYAEGTRAVIEGPGPERVGLRHLDEAVELGEVPAPETDRFMAASGAREFLAADLPEEVVARFDADRDDPMRDSLVEAREKVGAAERRRDRQRREVLAGAEEERLAAVEEADALQRGQVGDARRAIQEARQDAVDRQHDAVRGFESKIGSLAKHERQRLEGHVERVEGEVSREYDRVEKDNERQAEEGRKKAERMRKEGKKKSKKRSWWRRAKSWVSDQVKAIGSKIANFLGKIRDRIVAAINRVRNWAKRKIDQLAAFVKRAIGVFGGVLKVMVNALLGHTFPDLARQLNRRIDDGVAWSQAAVDRVADGLKKKVDEIADAMIAGVNVVFNAFISALNFAVNLLAAAIRGDWREVLRMILEAVLGVLGIDPEDFYAFVGRALGVIGSIVDAPGRFLGNCVEAVLAGFRNFGKNFLTHLRNGIIAWLGGPLGGVAMPERFDLMGVLDLARQVAGLTWEWLREKAVRLVGEENAERLDFVLDYVETLREEGWKGLFARLRDDLGNLAESVLGEIKEYLVEKLIIGAVKWIAALFTPAGALLKLLQTIWNLFIFLKDQLAHIWGIVTSVVASIADLVQGVFDKAAARIEDALASALVVAIDLLATLLELKGLGRKIRKIIGAVRKKIDGAVDKLIARVQRRFSKRKGGAADEAAEQAEAAEPEPADRAVETAPGKRARRKSKRERRERREKREKRGKGKKRQERKRKDAGTEDEEPRAARPKEKRRSAPPVAGRRTIGQSMAIRVPEGTPCRLFIEAVGPEATVMIEASPPRPLVRYLRWARDRAKSSPQLKKKYAPLIKTALRKRLPKLDRAADQLAAAEVRGDTERVLRLRTKVKRREAALHAVLVEILASPTLRDGEPVPHPLLVIFKEQIARAHPKATETIRETLKEKGEPAWERMTWPDVRDRLIAAQLLAAQGALAYPLSSQWAYGKALRRELAAELSKRAGKTETVGGNTYAYPDASAIRTFARKYVAKSFREGAEEVYNQARRQLRLDVFAGESLAKVVRDTLGPVIRVGLEKFWQGSEVDPELKLYVKGSTVRAFLTHMGSQTGGTAWKGTLTPDRFATLWKDADNRRHIANKIRDADKGKHEWIAGELTDRVINTARHTASTAGPIAAAKWVRYQNELRSPTEVLIFQPDLYYREVPYANTGSFVPPTRPGTRRFVDTGDVKVLQGHPGAVYAPVSEAGYQSDVIEQSKGKNRWHKSFNTRIQKSLPTGKIGLADVETIVKSVAAYFTDTIWNPASDPLPKPRFDYYFDKADLASTQRSYVHLKKRQTKAFRKELKKLTKPAENLFR